MAVCIYSQVGVLRDRLRSALADQVNPQMRYSSANRICDPHMRAELSDWFTGIFYRGT